MKKYYKIIKENMNMNGFKYKVGLNIDYNPINEQERSNGLHFSDKDNILRFLDYGTLICRVKIPKGVKVYDFKYKSKSNSIIIEEPMDIRRVETWEWIVQEGINIHVEDDCALRWASENGYLGIVKFLVKSGANIHAENDYALRWASGNGYLDIVKFLIEEGANVNTCNDCALRWASENGHLDVVKYLTQYIQNDSI